MANAVDERHRVHIAKTPSLAGICLAFTLLACLILALPDTASATQSRAAQFDTGYTVAGIGADDMLAVALAQEGRSQDSLGYTEGWCADFVSDCAKLLGQGAAIPFNGTVDGLYEDVLGAGGTVVSKPQPGDLVFFDFDHVGIMVDATNCISGNMGSPSKVSTCKCVWVLPGAGIVYVRPAYGAGAYKVAFKANGGTGSMSAQTIKRNAAKKLRANAFARTGYLFAGWNTKADGSGTAYADAQKVKNLGKAGKTVKLYAQWKKAKSRS